MKDRERLSFWMFCLR